LEIREVTTNDQLEDAYFVRKTVFVDEQHVPEEEEIDQFEAEASHVVLYDDKKPAGAGRVRLVDGYGKLERICVMKFARKMGAGKVIVNKLEDIASAKGAEKFKLYAQTHAIPFYEKLGYSVVSEEFMDAGIPHVTMTKNVH